MAELVDTRRSEDADTATLLTPVTAGDTASSRRFTGLGVLVVCAMLAFALSQHRGPASGSLRASDEIQMVLVDFPPHKHELASKSDDEETTQNHAPWQCARYEGDQNNTWCKTVGNLSGFEYSFFGPDSPCGDCWCCKRRTDEAIGCPNKDASCLDEQCCATPGFQCYEKTAFWAQCRQSCTPGPDPTDFNSDHWSCKELGDRAEGVPPPQDYEVQAAPWVQEECAGKGQNCTSSMCCQEAGMQCYTKSNGWASCKPECTAGPDPIDIDPSPWECKPLGSRTPGPIPGWVAGAADWVAESCSAQGENCTASKCCRDPGHQCYTKTTEWAMCLPSCRHGPLLTDANPDIWDCTALGGRTPGLARANPNPGAVADWVTSHCSADGENCTDTMCCSQPTSQCFEKDAGWATCMRGCAQGVHTYDDENPWSCKGLGPRTPRAWGTPSLYCFTVVQIWSPERDVVQTQLTTDGGVGIFACEQFDVLSVDGGVFLGDGPAGPVWSQHFDYAFVGRSSDGTAGNTRLFINAWEAVRYIGRYKNTDWTVKVDPDTVLIPDRLRWHVQSHMGRPTFIITCTLPGMKPIMFGAVEAISRDALQKYFDGRYDCEGLHTDEWGEDRWLSGCLEHLGAPGEEDFSMVSDGVCLGVDCGSGAAAFHPFKDAGSWQGCYWQAAGR